MILKYAFISLMMFLVLPVCGNRAKVIDRLHVGGGLSNNYVHGVVEDSRGRVWIATESGLNCYDGYGYKVYKTYNSSLKSNFINCLYRDVKRREILVGVKGYGIYSIDESSGIIKDITPKGQPIHNVMTIRPKADGLLLLYCPERVVTFQPATKRFLHVRTVGYDGLALLPNASKVYTDPFGNQWASTLGSGVVMTSRRSDPFTRVIGGSVYSVELGKTCIWAGGDDVLYRIDSHHQVKRIPLSYGSVHGHILSLSSRGGDQVLMAVGGCLLSYDVTTGQFRELRYQGKAVKAITFFYDEKTGVTWITALDGIYSLDKQRIVREDRLNSCLRHQQSNGLRVDDEGKIWIGTYEDGMYLFGKDKRLLRHYTQQAHFFTNSVMHLRLGANNRLWLATPDGIGLFDTRRPQSPRHFGFQQGLSDPFIRGVADTGDGNAWVTTNNGIAYFDWKRKNFYNFNRYDGVPEHNITGGILLLPDGKLMFTTMGGLYVADVASLLRPDRVSPVAFTACEVRLPDADKTSTNVVAPGNDGHYALDYDENAFVLAFSVLDKSQCRRTDYSYRIRELSDDWTLTDGNTISVIGLSPGNYTVEVRARLHGQPWSEASVVSTRLAIAYPWWQSWPARIIYVVFLIAVIGWGLKRYKRRLKEKSDLIIEKKMVETEKASNAERLQFFTNIAHELRTPLTLIFGPIEQLEQSKELGPSDRQHVGLIKSSAARLLMLINQLLDFRKAETHNKKLRISCGKLDELIYKIGEEFIQASNHPQVAISLQVHYGGQEIWFDSDVITTILNNLLSNAVKNTASGEIVLSLDKYEQEGRTFSRIKVTDTGCGIPEEALPHIFDRYFQVEGSHHVSGTGIGLALVKALCDLHKISLSVESRVGKGTVFTLLLDHAATYPEALILEAPKVHHPGSSVARVKESGGSTDGSNADAVSSRQKPVVLVVEDHVDINNYIADNLSQDYIVLQTVNGEEGLAAAKKEIPDVVITDIMMPVMDGIAMTRNLKTDIATSHIPVIMLTAKTEAEDQKEGYDNGADSYLTKPFSMSMLKARISNLLVARKTLARHILEMTKNRENRLPEADGKGGLRSLSRLDSQFLSRLNDVIQAHLADPKLNLSTIANELEVSQSTLYRKAKALTGVTTNEYIRKIRLEHCRRLLSAGTHNVSQAAYQSGFTDLAFFRTQFKQEFGITPNEYLRGDSRR